MEFRFQKYAEAKLGVLQSYAEESGPYSVGDGDVSRRM